MEKKKLRRWVWLGVSTAVLVLILYNLRHNPEWRHFNWKRLWASLENAQPGLLVLDVLLVYLTYVVRSYRWRLFMKPMKKASLWVLFVGQMLGFSSIYLVGRPGEFVRPAFIAKKEDVSISSQVAVWLLERIFDSVFLVVLFTAALFVVPSAMMTSGEHNALTVMRRAGDVMLALSFLVVAGLIAYRFRTQTVISWVSRKSRPLPRRMRRHVLHFMESFAEGLKVIRSLPEFLGSTVLTVVLWLMNASIFWIAFQSLGGRLGHMNWMAAALVMFCASLGLVVQFPGIGGGYQVGIILALTEIFAIEADVATGAAILLWLLMSVPVMALSLGLLIHEGLSIRRLEAITEEEELEREAIEDDWD